MPLHLGTPYGSNTNAARETRRYLGTKLRDDWEYSVLPYADDPSATTYETSREQAEQWRQNTAAAQSEATPLAFEPVAWQERDYSSSDVQAGGLSYAMDVDTEDYQFESAEDVGNALAAKSVRRKRKRAQVLQVEMEWNAGLAHFVARRDAWTCAKDAGTEQGMTGQRHPNNSSVAALHNDPSSASRSVSTPRTSETDSRSNRSNISGAEESSTPASSPIQPEHPPPESRVLLPIPPKMLPDHPIRTRINASTYAEIYSKIILQSRTPSVPINLSHITNSLIYGWTEEGNWPPKATMPEAPIAKRKKAEEGTEEHIKHPHLKRGVQAVGRVLGLGASSGHGTNGH